EPLLRAVVEVPLEPAAGVVLRLDDSRTGGLQLPLLMLPVGDLPDDQEELALAGCRHAAFVVAGLAVEVELVFERLRPGAGECLLRSGHDPVGEVPRQAV